MANQFAKKSIDFDVYQKQDPASLIDWGKQAKVISDTFTGIAEEREKKKAAIEKSFADQQTKLNELGEYDNPTAQQIMMNAGTDGANKLLDVQNLVKRGLMKPSEATMFKQNQLNGFNLLKQNMANFDKTFQEYTTRLQTIDEKTGLPKSAPAEEYLATLTSGFANLNNISVQTDPTTGNVSLLRLGDDGKPVEGGDSMTVNRLTLLMKQQIDNFDVGGAVQKIKGEIGNTTKTIAEQKYGPNVVITKEMMSKVEDEYLNSEDGQGFLDNKIKQITANPMNINTMIINANMKTDNGESYKCGSQEDYDKWMAENNNDEKNNPFLVLEFGKDNQYKAVFNETQRKKAEEYVKNQIKGAVDYEKTQTTKGLNQYQQDTAFTGGQKKERNQNFSYVDQAAKIVSGSQQEFQEGVATLAESYNNSDKGKKNPLADDPVDRNSDPNFILVTYESGEVKKIPRYQLDLEGDPVLDDDGNKIPRDQQQQNAEILSYMSPVEGSTDQIYKEYNKENPGGIKDYGGSDKEVKFLGVGDKEIKDTDLTNYPVLIDGKAGQLSDKFLKISQTESDDEVVLDLYKGEIDAILSKTFKGLDSTFEVEVDDIVTGYGHRNKIYVTIDGVKTTIDFDTKDESSKLLSELQKAINAAKTKIRDKRTAAKKKKSQEQKKKQDDKKKNKKPNVG